ncbi:MAG: hypothetical protein HKN50_01390 [Gammaproteobacteria bacterium]|nr:hypothetical protein [Gammaproteobacteria bacterium]
MQGFVGFPAAGTFCFDLDLINDGGSASSYVLGPQEAGNIDTIIIPGTSKIMFTMPSAPEDYYFWDSDIAATNGSGEHTRQLFFDNEEFDFEFADNPLLSCP